MRFWVFRLWLGSHIIGSRAWHEYLKAIRDAKESGGVPMNWPSNELTSMVKADDIMREIDRL